MRTFVTLSLIAAALAGGLSAGGPVAALAAVFPPPTLLTPADGATTTLATHPPLGIPEFTWERVSGATTYRIQFSQDIAFTTRVETVTANPGHTPTDATRFGDGVWYWRVRVEGPSTSEWSEIRSFTKQWASPESAAELIAPADGAALDFYDTPIFSWRAVTGAAAYRFQIAASSDGFGAPRYSQETLGTTHQPPTKLTNGVYYWRVIPLDAARREGVASAVRAFSAAYLAPVQLLEPDAAAAPTFTPAFRWAAARGAQFYRLQYATDASFNVGLVTVDTRNTSHTPLTDLPNDVNYYWRVRAHSGNSVADWSETRSFVKRWYLQPQLLTPPNNYQHVWQPPLFSWAPAPGASYYKIEVNNANSFPPGQQGWTATTANPFWNQPNFDKLPNSSTWYWRVTPYDRNQSAGLPSEVFSFEYDGVSVVPELISPLPYYAPSPLTAPAEDRRIPWPIFAWQRLNTPAYRLQVAADPLFDAVDWQLDTQNPGAAPSDAQPFQPQSNRDYYWRVRMLDGLGGVETGPWSQIWHTRFDPSRAITASLGLSVTLLRPAHASETVETGPLLEWQPLAGADSYDVQISTGPDFAPADIVRAASVLYPAYLPTTRLGYGTYFWRVLGRDGGIPLGEWSAVWRFQVAADSRWQDTRAPLSVANRNLVGFDPPGDMLDPNYDVTTLNVVQDKDDWFFGFDATPGVEDMVYALYLDLDHVDGSGAITDPRGYTVTTSAAHQPEVAIYVLQNSGGFTSTQTFIYRWSVAGWGVPQRLSDLGLDRLRHDAGGQYLELRVPNTAIGMQEATGSAALMLFTVQASGGHAQDTVPADPSVAYSWPDSGAGTTLLSRFASVTGRAVLASPPTAAGGDPTAHPTLLPFAFHAPSGAPWHGYNLQAALDARFTSPVLDYTLRYNVAGYAPTVYTHNKDLNGDNTYYWRVRPIYDWIGLQRGAWSEASAFERAGFVPQNLRASIAFATPTFSWDRIEGVEAYDLQVDDDPNFGLPTFSVTTSGVSYTWHATLSQGTHYWRVRGRRYGSIANSWSTVFSFALGLAEPTGLFNQPASPAAWTPSLCWTPVVTPTTTAAQFAAWKYRVQVGREPTFSSEYDKTDTEQACWTPVKGYPDGAYYWRVAALDGDGKVGDYSPAATFLKQYPVTSLVAPVSGAPATSTPTFVWTAVTGAASYRLEVSLDATFTPLYDSVTTANTRFTPTKKYDPGSTYFWRVAMVDRDGNRGPFTGDQVVVRQGTIYLPVVARQ